jgi:A/G-specific adenine glycosylase
VTRVLGFDADLAQGVNVRALWDAATQLLPVGKDSAAAMPRYTQGMMDLGATVCLPKKPACLVCPVHQDCAAAEAGDPQRYPVRTRTLKRSSQAIWLLWVQSADGAVWLDKRPTPGVWAGLHCLPLFDSEDTLVKRIPVALKDRLQALPVFTHVLTHKDLYLHTWQLRVPDASLEWGAGQWIGADAWPDVGLPAPIRKLLQQGVAA